MSKKVTNSISYVFNEMDPSEEVEFERELSSNNNLLIEVESLKKTKGQLDNLPLMEPPKNVVSSIQQHAERYSRSRRRNANIPIYTAFAAVFLIGLTSGFFLLNQPENSSGETNRAGLNNVPLLQNSTSTSASSTTRERIKPWVDENEVIRFTDRFQAAEQTSFDSIFKNSFQKLTPVTDPVERRAYQQSLQLTGSRQ